MDIGETIVKSYQNYFHYLWYEITHPHFHNFFYWFLGLSFLFLFWEWVAPWRENQSKFRKDFWLDAGYMFFNLWIFSLIVFNAASNVVVVFFNQFLSWFHITNLVSFEVLTWPTWTHLLIGFVVKDFVHWNVHRLLHRIPFLWAFHKLHHSVKEMGFAAHLRFHWMETVIYRTFEYLPLALLGIGLRDFFIVHIFTLAVGHFNHSNISVKLGWLQYIFNNPQMHIWHHAKNLPKKRKYGVNFGLTLSIWDYIFKTDFIPYDGKNELLGFEKDELYPKTFFSQITYGFKNK